MPERLTDARIDELLALEAKATPSPWECGRVVDPGLTFDADVDIFPPDTTETHGFQFGGPVCVVSGRSEGDNHEFIAASRNSIRSLLEEVKTQRRVVDCLKTAAILAVLNFERINHSGGDLFDDDHEAWTALNAALHAEREGKNR